MIYKNTTDTAKTFYSVTFQPGEEHDVPGYINYDGFVPVTETDSSDGGKKSGTSAKSTSTSTKKEVNTDGSDSDK